MSFPFSWDRTTIGDSLILVRGVSFPKDVKRFEPSEGYVACLRTTNVQRDVEWDNLWFIPEHYVKRDEQFIKPFDILISNANSLELVGKVAQVNRISQKATLGAFISLIRVPNSLNPKYIYYLLSSSMIQGQIHALASTTTNISNISIGKLATVEIPIAPIGEQERIVERIESLFTRLDAGVAGLRRAQAALKRYRASVLKAACEGRLAPQDPHDEPAEELLRRLLAEKGQPYRPVQAEGLAELPRGWVWVISDQLFNFVTSGSRGWAKYYSDTGATFLRIGNLDHDTIDLDLGKIQKVSLPNATEGMRTRVKENDILVSITADIGMIGLVNNAIGEAYINQHISLARPVKSINAEYLAWFLASEHGQKQFVNLQRGATKMGLGLNDIANIHIPIPPVEEQFRIVEEIDRRLSMVRQMESTITAGLARAARLRQSILKLAFAGRLVGQEEKINAQVARATSPVNWGERNP